MLASIANWYKLASYLSSIANIFSKKTSVFTGRKVSVFTALGLLSLVICETAFADTLGEQRKLPIAAKDYPANFIHFGNASTTAEKGNSYPSATVNINKASAEQLASVLPGIGIVKARRIVAERATNGPFRSAEDLLRVKGIGDKILEKIRSQVML